MQWVASTLHTTSEHGVSSITTADAHTLAASSRLNWCPRADLNRLFHFAERRNLVSARVPSRFKRSLLVRASETSNLLSNALETERKASPASGTGSNAERCRCEVAAISENCAQTGKTKCRGWQRTAIPLLAAQVSMSGRSFISYRAHNLLIQHSVYWQWLTAGTWVTSDSDSAAADIHSRQKFAKQFLILLISTPTNALT